MSELDLSSQFKYVNDIKVHELSDAGSRVALRSPRKRFHPALVLKYSTDVVLAFLGLIVLAPMILMVAGVLLVLQGRPIFIFHKRIGKNGNLFDCIKFRTMVRNADQFLEQYLASNPEARKEWEATRKLKSDPRITAFGGILRSSSIDEIPQLFNILRGEMSLVGPRPITTGEAQLYGHRFIDYIAIRPGLTGLWQVSGRNEISYNARVELDARYVAEQSFVGDMVIILKTIPAVLARRGSY
ncbi:sugar transferase [Roseibium marinum]|uniref:Exopolysaccharide production protein ExoY n=1 Tax=Roseibium marinum TaxID=281252 RepID=A0A2S3UU28_9HYPH|nr:sugar transferase [Roseibium marinum]POF31083.1 exopolysaccharide production protein ExoY [Roseibium marinum]